MERLPPDLLHSPTYCYISPCNNATTDHEISNNTCSYSTKNRQLNSTRGSKNLSMSSCLLILIMLLSLSLATSFCEGRSASFLHSRKDIAKTKVKKPSSTVSSMSEATTEKTDRVTEIPVKSITHRSDHRKEDNIRRENSSSYAQKPDFVAVSLHKTPYSASEEKPGFDLDYALPRIHTPSHN